MSRSSRWRGPTSTTRSIWRCSSRSPAPPSTLRRRRGCARSCCTATGRASAPAWTWSASWPAGGGVAGLTDQVEGASPNLFQRVAYDWIRVPVPVIAAVHGNCLGGGLQIALGADIRIAAPDARLSVMEVKWGLIPDMAITRTLPRLVSIDVAKELTYQRPDLLRRRGAGARPRHARRRRPAGRRPRAGDRDREPLAGRRSTRQAAVRQRLGRSTAADSLALEAELQLQLIGSPNQLAAVAAGFNREPAEFTDPEPAGLASLDQTGVTEE